jgi:hypothetical protein
MTLSIDSERWWEWVIGPGSLRDLPVRCGDVAISLCEGCGVALCESHELRCGNCSRATCLNCAHVCRADAESLKIGAA